MNRLVQSWKIAEMNLELDIVTPFKIKLHEGVVEADVLVKNFGAPKGMLVFNDSILIAPFRKSLLEIGYAASSYSQPDEDAFYEREDFIRMLSGWGWTGEPHLKPSWIDEE